jgi:hypothetical protein
MEGSWAPAAYANAVRVLLLVAGAAPQAQLRRFQSVSNS